HDRPGCRSRGYDCCDGTLVPNVDCSNNSIKGHSAAPLRLAEVGSGDLDRSTHCTGGWRQTCDLWRCCIRPRRNCGIKDEYEKSDPHDAADIPSARGSDMCSPRINTRDC